MSDYSVTEIFAKILEGSEFRNDYFLSFLDRFCYSATDLEKKLSSDDRKLAIQNLLEAFNYLMNNQDERLALSDIISVGNMINKEAGIEGLRKIFVSAGRLADWEPVMPSKIYYSLYSLLSNYYEVWTERDIYEKEAAFHIALMRIHPFEDGNKRTAKIILNANFVKQNYPPVVITEGETEVYYKFINDQDVIGFAKFLKSKSLQELSNLISYYKITHKIPITDSVVDTIINDGGGRK